MPVVYGAHGVDYVGRREGVRGCDFRGARGAAVQESAFPEEGGARGRVDGAVLEGGVSAGSDGFGKGFLEGGGKRGERGASR